MEGLNKTGLTIRKAFYTFRGGGCFVLRPPPWRRKRPNMEQGEPARPRSLWKARSSVFFLSLVLLHFVSSSALNSPLYLSFGLLRSQALCIRHQGATVDSCVFVPRCAMSSFSALRASRALAALPPQYSKLVGRREGLPSFSSLPRDRTSPAAQRALRWASTAAGAPATSSAARGSLSRLYVTHLACVSSPHAHLFPLVSRWERTGSRTGPWSLSQSPSLFLATLLPATDRADKSIPPFCGAASSPVASSRSPLPAASACQSGGDVSFSSGLPRGGSLASPSAPASGPFFSRPLGLAPSSYAGSAMRRSPDDLAQLDANSVRDWPPSSVSRLAPSPSGAPPLQAACVPPTLGCVAAAQPPCCSSRGAEETTETEGGRPQIPSSSGSLHSQDVEAACTEQQRAERTPIASSEARGTENTTAGEIGEREDTREESEKSAAADRELKEKRELYVEERDGKQEVGKSLADGALPPRDGRQSTGEGGGNAVEEAQREDRLREGGEGEDSARDREQEAETADARGELGRERLAQEKKKADGAQQAIALRHLQRRFSPGHANYRVQKELQAFLSNPPPNCRVYVHPSNIRVWLIEMTGIKGSPYENETYRLKVVIPPDYPFKAPTCFFLQPTPVHPHVYSNGDICLNLLGSDWRPSLSISAVAVAILSMLTSAKQKQLPMDNAAHVDVPAGHRDTQFLYHDDKV
ncbi:putative ubiquitin conjugating enzyme E2 [Besnoitia besnoiti]|uniref:Putative ubiquitin conjugating enzyme E2 n=1 Tax=Besnoitia besnoiti TaxID=94643 RepID=A0A2A9M709_BESBE|nr:putative ubiquitin conjugating enzyme E2 [Besnoitia besnoiti]PFH31676.1 putative ubiquitin conjugating enzyme E2 [Besnoitia besnoiti]